MKTEVLIIGGGPGGCAAAMFLSKEGINPIIVEQEEFPRFHIGESMTGEAANLLRRLGLGEVMEERDYPVKHGVRVFGKSAAAWFIPVARRDENCDRSPPHRWSVDDVARAYQRRDRGCNGGAHEGPRDSAL